jgi:ElaB/YqjD/DUF883 family membrane-anchored ribosome-binding protein
MLQQTIKTSDGKTAFPLDIGVGISEQTARLRKEAEELKERAGEMLEDAVLEAKRLAKKGRYAAEDLIDDTEYRIKKAPFRSVGMTFAAGLGLGVFAGWLFSRLSCGTEK